MLQQRHALKDLLPCLCFLVHCWNESQRRTAWVSLRTCTIWWSLAAQALIWPSKPIVSALFRLQRVHRSAWKKLIQTSGFARGVRERAFHFCAVYWLSCRNTFIWINKPPVIWSCLKSGRCGWFKRGDYEILWLLSQENAISFTFMTKDFFIIETSFSSQCFCTDGLKL